MQMRWLVQSHHITLYITLDAKHPFIVRIFTERNDRILDSKQYYFFESMHYLFYLICVCDDAFEENALKKNAMTQDNFLKLT